MIPWKFLPDINAHRRSCATQAAGFTSRSAKSILSILGLSIRHYADRPNSAQLLDLKMQIQVETHVYLLLEKLLN